MWSQWSAGPPPMPPPTSNNPQVPLIGPVQPAGTSIPSGPAPAPPTQIDPQPPTPSYTPAPPTPNALPVVQPVSYQSGAPSYTPAQYAAMTPEQQYAVQQHWQQWQAYEQQYAQWHAQYGEQYKREMAAIQSTPQPTVVPFDTTGVSNAYNYPPPAISNPYQAPLVPVSAPPPPPPDENTNSKGIKAPAQLYEQPPPPPPPPQQETSIPNRNDAIVQSQSASNSQGQNSILPQSLQNQENRWNQPPPFSGPNSGNRLNEPNEGQYNHNDIQHFNQQNRQQQNQQNRQQNQFSQQDRQQQNLFNQQFNNNNPHGRQNQNSSRNQHEDEQGRNNWQGNRQNNNNFRGRNRGRNGNYYETERQFDDSDGRINYQQPSWQSDNSGERNNRGSFSNRFDNSYDNFNKNLGQINQHGSNNWNNSVQSGSFGTPEALRQKKSSENQITPNEKTQTGGSVDEKAFDEQFRLWEEQFENWKKENANHPDRTMYMRYEKEFEKTRVRLLERREQMRRRKMMEMQQKSNSQVESQELVVQHQQPSQSNPEQEKQQLEPNLPQKQTISLETTKHIQQENYNNDSDKTGKLIETQKPIKTAEIKHCENSDMEQSEPEEIDPVLSTKLDDPSKGVENETEGLNISETSIFQKQEMTDLFKTGGGIPGLDLVGSKDGDVVDNLNEKTKCSNVIDLDTDGPSRPPKLSATSINSGIILTTTQPQLLTNIDSRPQSLFVGSQSQNSQPPKRKIPSLFDIVVEKPVLSPDTEKKSTSPLLRNSSPVGSKTSKSDIPPDPESHSRSISRDRDILASPAQRPLSQMSMEQCTQQSLPNQQSNLPPHTADLAKALQDPNVMQLLSVALAQAQKSGCINPTGNVQQNQILQQLQQLQPLIQMQQERNFNNQQWDNSQLERPQPWRNQNQNFDNRFNTNMNQNENSNNRFNPNVSQNRNPFDSNPFNQNDDQMNRSQRSGSVNLCDSNRDMSQKNPRNPFRRGGGIEDKANGGMYSEKDVEGMESGRGSFGNTSNNAFSAPINPQQQQRGGNFVNKNFGRDFGGGQGNFGGQNFGGRNFEEENFSRGGDNFGGGDSRDNNYDRHNFDEGNSSGGGSFNNRPDLSFKNSLGFRNNTNNFGDRGVCDNDYFRPTQIFDYQNRSRPEALMPPAKIVDYGHKPSALLPATSFSRDNNEFVPVKTIDYGHASSSAKPRNPFQEKNDIQTKKKINRWGQEQEKNEEQHQQQRSQTQGSRGNDNETKTNALKNNQKQNENLNENKTEELSRLAKTENVKELDSENLQEYPKSKWILQNPENRQRPGPPTKRGKRNSTQVDPEPIKDEAQAEVFECDEIEENFEEISDNECSIIEDTDIPPRDTQIKKKSVSLFPSVSDSNKNPSMIIPSNENNNTIPIDEILFKPGRLTRPKNIVIIMRGPPGSGKSHVAKLIKDKEVEMGGQTPRLLSVDDYFMVENDYEEKCPKTGRKIPKKEILYEYEKEMESTYMQYLIKSFKKTVTDHLFDFIIVDCGNQSLRTFNEFYNAARDGNFSPFVIDLKCDLETCLEQNIHNRKEEDIKEIIENYQDCPGHYIKLDVSNLLENVVEMEDVSDLEDHFVADSEIIELDDEEVEDEGSDNNDDGFLKSKWDTDPTTENLARLDGTSKPISKRGTATLEEYLQIDGWEPPASNTNGKKRVRWADIEEKRAQDKMRAIGFVVGQTDWNRMMDPTSGSGALTKTKYIERLNKRR